VRLSKGSFKNTFTYTDQEIDAETGLMYFGARYYQPRLARWISNDPLQRDIKSMVKFNELNGYGYVRGNPVNYVDEDGRLTISEWKLSIAHPNVALQVWNIKEYVEDDVSSKFAEGFHNGKADAYRHALWNAIMIKELGSDWTKSFADAHEDFEGNPKEEKQMDIYNNQQGREIGEQYLDSKYNWEDIAATIKQALEDGKLQTEINEYNDNEIECEAYYDDGAYADPYVEGAEKTYDKQGKQYDKLYKEDYEENDNNR
jgi:RHS repeat-associated protein